MGDKIRLLLVDDEVKFLNSLARRLEIRGFDVFRAENGLEAIEAARNTAFDLAILDLKMSKMRGDEVLKILKDEHEELEVLILTGHGSMDFAVECTKLGAFCYLPKPYELEKLLHAMKEAYAARLKKKYSSDEKLLQKIEQYNNESSPLDILKNLCHLDNL